MRRDGVDPNARWYVELVGGGTHDVGAASMFVAASGALIFLDQNETVSLAYAPTAWIAVTSEESAL